MVQAISMSEATRVAQQATHHIEAWLGNLPQTRDLKNVEADRSYQQVDVDLLWTTRKDTYKIEIKGDRWHKTGNFFFETHSNKEKNTPGCFLYTQADLLFYYFIEPAILYILPMPQTRDWFLKNRQRFKERSTTTPVGQDHYTTVGRLVPIATVITEVSGIKKYHLKEWRKNGNQDSSSQQ